MRIGKHLVYCLVLLLLGGAAHAAPPIPTTTTVSFSPPSPVADGTIVTITGHVQVTTSGAPVAAGKIQIKEWTSDGVHGVPCGTPGATEVELNDGGTAVNSNGNATVLFDTTGLAGQTIGFSAHYVPAGSGFHESQSPCSNLSIIANSPCVNSNCCTLTQGAYGGPGAVGYVAVAITAGSNPFTLSGSPQRNATTIGVPGTASVTLADLLTLQGYLPHGTAPSSLTISGDQVYSVANPIPTIGFGGGVLGAQSMTCGLNVFLSAVPGVFTATPSNLSNYKPLTPLVCTRRVGSDKIFGSADDTCQAFSVPSCAVDKTVAQIKAAADQQLAQGSNSLGCSADDLNQALDNINNQFDECGRVIACPGGVSAPGVFLCQ